MLEVQGESRNERKLMREYFIAGEYDKAEPRIISSLRSNARQPELMHMLATIYYDKGKFKKSIKTFKQALSIDPDYTDAAVGLSIVLNDIGKYKEAAEVFETAQKRLDKKQEKRDYGVEAKIITKHIELAELYTSYQRYQLACDQLMLARGLANTKEVRRDISLQIIDCFELIGDRPRAVSELRRLRGDFPDDIAIRQRISDFGG